MPKIELYPHNQAALNHLEEALKYTRRAAVIQPTGTGKSFVALAFIERRPNNSFLYLCTIYAYLQSTETSCWAYRCASPYNHDDISETLPASRGRTWETGAGLHYP